LFLFLGGAALQRCDKSLVFNDGFTAEGNRRDSREFFSKLFSRAAKGR